MKILTEGKYEFRDGTLFVEAKHEDAPCLLAIDREALESNFGVTATGRFQEYWTSVLQNREQIEAAAGRKAGNAPADTIRTSSGDLQPVS